GQSSQRTVIGPRRPGSGRPAPSRSTASRPAAVSRTQSCTVKAAPARRQVPTTSPSTRTLPGQTRGVGDQELAVGAVEEQERVAARQESRRGGRARRRSERRLVGGEDPRLADRRPDRRQLRGERLEDGQGGPGSETRPPAEGRGRRRPADVEVPAG